MRSELLAFDAHPVDVPPGYPREYERRLCLSDGRAIEIRPIIPGDQTRLREAFQTADTETLYRRFLGNSPHLTAERLAYWCTVDYRRRFALVACDWVSGESVAVARYEPVEDGVAEVAVVVDVGWRRIGVATALVEMLAEAALERGVHSFGASYLADNQPVAALVGLAGGSANRKVWRGVAEVAVQLDRAPATAVQASAGARPPGCCPLTKR
jgi:GNAT superfamily N-acetyltransferase